MCVVRTREHAMHHAPLIQQRPLASPPFPIHTPFPSAMPILTPLCHPPRPPTPTSALRGKTPFRCFHLDASVHSLKTAEPVPNLSKQATTSEQTSSLLPACLSMFLVFKPTLIKTHVCSPKQAIVLRESNIVAAVSQRPVIASLTNKTSIHQSNVL